MQFVFSGLETFDMGNEDCVGEDGEDVGRLRLMFVRSCECLSRICRASATATRTLSKVNFVIVA